MPDVLECPGPSIRELGLRCHNSEKKLQTDLGRYSVQFIGELIDRNMVLENNKFQWIHAI
jgi:hypothetical protein